MTVALRSRVSAPARWWRAEPRLSSLRLLAIVLPVVFFVLIDALQHNVAEEFWHSTPGVLMGQAVVWTMIAGFAYTVFRVIERSEREQARQAGQIQALQQLSNAVSKEFDLNAIVAVGLEQVLESTHADAGVVCRVYPEELELKHLCKQGLGPEVTLGQRTEIPSDPIAARVVSRSRSVLFSEFADDPAVRSRMEREGIEAGISVPLRSATGINGILAVAYRTAHEITDAEREFLESAGQQLGLVIHNASLYEEAINRGQELSALLAVSSAAARSIEIDEVLERALDGVAEIAAVDAAEVWLLGGGELRMRCHHGGAADEFPGGREMGCPREIADEVCSSGQSITIGNTLTDRRTGGSTLTEGGLQTLTVIPIRYRQDVLGVLATASYARDAFSPSAVGLLAAIADQIAPAIANAALHAQLQDAAVLSERERISREMHDGLAQVLGYVNTQVLGTRKLLADGRLAEADTELSHLEETAREVYEEVREGILALRTPPLLGGNVIETLREYADHFGQMSGIAVQFEVRVRGGVPSALSCGGQSR